MQITLVPDSSVALAPAGFTAAVEAAAAIYEQDFPGNYNINISYGWGTFDNAPMGELSDPSNQVFSLGGPISAEVSYSQLKSWLTASAVSSDQIAADATLPATSASFPNDPSGTFFISYAEEKALGVFTGNSSALDGSIGFNIGDASSPQDWEPAALTEIAHALGWDSIAQGGSFPDVADLFRYSSPGQYGWTSGRQAYFSINGGATDLADFATSFDQTLFSPQSTDPLHGLPADDPLAVPFTSAATTLTAFDIEALSVIGFGVANVVSPPAQPRPFIASGNSSEILWQNAGGQASIWEMSGTSRIGGGAIGDPGSSWTDVATGDFYDNGDTDILWQNADGQVSIWEMDGSTRIGGKAVSDNPGTAWRAIGTGDFDHNGFSDILWQNKDTGQISIWEMEGNTRSGGGAVSANPGPTWRAVGTGDFYGNGDSDILLQNTGTGQVSIWEMKGSSRIGGGLVGADPGPGWTALGTGDFYGNGDSDIVFRNTSTGQVSVWEMNGNTRIGGGLVSGNPGLSWTAVGDGEFGNGGHSDILFQNTSGQVSIWEMNGNTRIGGGPVSPNPGASWYAA